MTSLQALTLFQVRTTPGIWSRSERLDQPTVAELIMRALILEDPEKCYGLFVSPRGLCQTDAMLKAVRVAK